MEDKLIYLPFFYILNSETVYFSVKAKYIVY